MKRQTHGYLLFAIFMFIAVHTYAQRQVIDMNMGWRFMLEDVTEAEDKAYDDTDWRILNLPHDWAFEEGVSIDGAQKDRGGYYAAGIGWYRKSFDFQTDWEGKVIYLEFDGVYMNSEVWVNDHYLGLRPYGYISFRYEISQFLDAGENIISVRVDNSKEPSARWYHPCGIYAPVRLVIADPLHIAPNGIYITTPDIQSNTAQIRVETELINMRHDRPEATLHATILGPNGNQLASLAVETKDLQANNNTLIHLLEVNNPLLWSPQTPTLYTLISRIYAEGHIVDEVHTRFGIRDIEWHIETGFWINGQNVKLKGVCEHYTGGPVGGAWTRPLMKWKLQLLKDMGVNAIRTAHNPATPMFYELCDEMGFFVMDEIFDGWGRKAEHDYGAQAFSEWWQRDMTEWLTRNRNHPSIVIYSVGNETRGDVAPELVALCHTLDPTRPVTSGHSNSRDMDVFGVNGGSERQGFFTSERLNKPFVATEAPHTWQTRGYYRTKTWYRDGFPNPRQQPFELPDLTENEIFHYEWTSPRSWNNHKQHFNSSYDNAMVRITARKNWELMRDLPWFSGHFRWTGFDYYGEAGYVHGGWPFRLFMGGAIDVAGFEKDLFYFYQSQWTEQPMVHILPHWTHPRMEAGTEIPVWVYSNADEVELLVNGVSLGIQKPGIKWDEMQCEWMVPYKEGTLEAIAFRDGVEVDRTRMATAGAPASLQNTVEYIGPGSDERNYFIITTDGTDADKQINPYAENRVYYSFDDGIELISLENGDPVDTINSVRSNFRKLFMGKTRAFLRTHAPPEQLHVTVGSILGDKQLYVSDRISIHVACFNLNGASSPRDFQVRYSTDGSDPLTHGLIYSEPFAISGNTVVRAEVFAGEKHLFSMKEAFGEGEGLYWIDPLEFNPWTNTGSALQAESAEFNGAKALSTGKQFRGTGFVHFDQNEGWIRWSHENDGADGTYKIKVRYAHGAQFDKCPMKLVVNDDEKYTIDFEPTGSWNTDWKYIETDVQLTSGANYIELRTLGGCAPNIDELIIFW